jgi:hypothetical protein
VTAPPELLVEEVQIVIDDVVETLVFIQRLPVDSRAAQDLHAAVTVARVARARLSRLVADARDEQVSWADIGRILGPGRLWAVIRYGPLVRRRRTPLILD